MLRANHIHVTNDDHTGGLLTQEVKQEFASFWQQHQLRPMAGRNLILASLCPQVYGLYVVKLAVALVLTGGVQVR